MLPAKRREENCTGKGSRGLRNQDGEHLVNLCQSNILETTYNQLARILFPFEKTNNIKITDHRV